MCAAMKKQNCWIGRYLLKIFHCVTFCRSITVTKGFIEKYRKKGVRIMINNPIYIFLFFNFK